MKKKEKSKPGLCDLIPGRIPTEQAINNLHKSIIPLWPGESEEIKPEENQKIKADAGKTDWFLLPFEPLEMIVKVFNYGLKKYGKRGSWKNVNPDRYKKALMRHVIAWKNGEWLDYESGLPHLSHAGWNIIVLLWFYIKDGFR